MNDCLKILVTGSNGQLGSELKVKSMGSEHQFIFTDIQELDILDRIQLEEKFQLFKPDVVINCAAYTAVDLAETEQEKASLLNVTAVQYIASLAYQYKAKVIHVSTDYVFDGRSFYPYNEDHDANPLSVYGYTKLQGERVLMESGCDGIVIRTSWLYSNYGKNFYKTISRIAKEQQEISIVFDQVGTPTYAADLADAIFYILPQLNTFFGVEVYHFSNEGVCSWYDFAHAIIKKLKLNTTVYPIHSDEYPTAAQRPFYGVLDKSKIKSAFGIQIDHWQTALDKCINNR